MPNNSRALRRLKSAFLRFSHVSSNCTCSGYTNKTQRSVGDLDITKIAVRFRAMRPGFLKSPAGKPWMLRCVALSACYRYTWTVVVFSILSIAFALMTALPAGPASPKRMSDRDWKKMGKDLNFRNGTTKYMTKTKIFPFRTGCPEDCDGLRRAQELHLEEVYFRTGTLFKMVARAVERNATREERQIWHLPLKMGEAFDETEADVVERLRRLPFALEHVMFFHKQKWMHVSLSYDCCLTRKEAQTYEFVLRRWLAEKTFHLPLHFTHLECWLERYNSLTIIAVVDDLAQRHLLRWNYEFMAMLRENGVPVLVDRTDQMPFHMTFLGVFLGDEFSPQQRDRMEVFAEDICREVLQTSQQQLGTREEALLLDFVPEMAHLAKMLPPKWWWKVVAWG